MWNEIKKDPLGWIIIAVLVAVVGFVLFKPVKAKAHSWYDIECCHQMDCAPVTAISFLQPMEAAGLPQMVVTTKVGTAIVPKNFKLRESKDGEMHACMKVHDPNPATRFLCLYLPPGN